MTLHVNDHSKRYRSLDCGSSHARVLLPEREFDPTEDEADLNPPLFAEALSYREAEDEFEIDYERQYMFDGLRVEKNWWNEYPEEIELNHWKSKPSRKVERAMKILRREEQATRVTGRTRYSGRVIVLQAEQRRRALRFEGSATLSVRNCLLGKRFRYKAAA